LDEIAPIACSCHDVKSYRPLYFVSLQARIFEVPKPLKQLNVRHQAADETQVLSC